jgi:hypothetical protein
LLLPSREEHRLEELPYHAKGEVALELRSARPQHLHILRGLSRRSQQARLADPRRPLDDCRGPLTPARRGTQALELLEFTLPLHQRRPHHLHMRHRTTAEPRSKLANEASRSMHACGSREPPQAGDA